LPQQGNPTRKEATVIHYEKAELRDDPNIEHEPHARILLDDAITRLKIGDCVKVCAGFDAHDGCAGERFRVEVTALSHEPALSITGTVANDLIYTCYHGYLRGSVVTVAAPKIYGVDVYERGADG
jgi:hypothetical protein